MNQFIYNSINKLCGITLTFFFDLDYINKIHHFLNSGCNIFFFLFLYIFFFPIPPINLYFFLDAWKSDELFLASSDHKLQASKNKCSQILQISVHGMTTRANKKTYLYPNWQSEVLESSDFPFETSGNNHHSPSSTVL